MKSNKWIIISGAFAALVAFLIIKSETIINMTLSKIWDVVSARRIETLHPSIRAVATAFINEAERQGIKLRVTFALRTFAEQNELYAQGRTKPGKIVTWATGGRSYHNYGLALDVVEIKDNKALWINPNWDKIGQIGESFGFEWGGRWSANKLDRPHFQRDFNYSVNDLLALHTSNETEMIDGYIKLT